MSIGYIGMCICICLLINIAFYIKAINEIDKESRELHSYIDRRERELDKYKEQTNELTEIVEVLVEINGANIKKCSACPHCVKSYYADTTSSAGMATLHNFHRYYCKKLMAAQNQKYDLLLNNCPLKKEKKPLI